MELTLKNYATALPKDILLLAKKNKVRECDETEKGHFVAYVDDGDESYDVSLTVKAAGKIGVHTCDCDSGLSFCRHKAALLAHLATGEKTKVTVKVKKKESKAEALLEAAAPAELKEWVRGMLTKNKDIELSFVHHFAVKEQLTPVEVTKITNDAIKAVVGNKSKIDQTQLKKLVELWEQVHTPVIDYYHADPTNEKSFLNFHTLLEACLAFQQKADTGSNRVPKYVEVVLQKSVQAVANLFSEEAWDKAISYFVEQVPEVETPERENRVRMHYLLHLKNMIAISSESRKLKIIGLLAIQFGKSDPGTLVYGNLYIKFIFEIIKERGLFAQYYQLFKPIRFDNDYNLELLRLLMENGHLDTAKKFSSEQITGNFREDFSIPYLKILKEIAVHQKDEEGLARVLTVLFPYTFNFHDYLFIARTLSDDERKKWRTKMLTRARNAAHGNNDAMEFCFRLVDHEKNYKKMIDYINSYTRYRQILQYFEPMMAADKAKVLDAILSKSDSYGHYADAQDDAACFPELLALAEKHYTASYLRAAISQADKNRYFYTANKFVVYMKKRLF